MQSSIINYDIFANAARYSAEFGGNVLDKAVQGIGSIRFADVRAGIKMLKDNITSGDRAGYTDMLEHIGKITNRSSDTDDSTPVSPAILGVTDKLLGVFYRHAVTAAMGGFPTHNMMQIAHLNAAACEDLISNTRVYQAVRRGGDAFVWDTRKTRSGDVIGRMHTEAFSKAGFSPDEIRTGVSVSFAGIGGLELGDRTMVVFGSTTFGADTDAGVEIALGGLRLRKQAGFSHFGISVPTQYLDKLIVHTKGRNSVYCHFQTGAVDKSLGILAEHRGVNESSASIRLSNAVQYDVDYQRVPQSMFMYRVTWTGNTQTVLSFKRTQFLNIGSLTLLLDVPKDFDILTPSRRSGTVSYFAALAFSHLGESSEQYVQLANIIGASRHPIDTVGVALSDDEKCAVSQLELCSKQTLTPGEYHLGTIDVHTFEGNVVTSYKAAPAGLFDFSMVPEHIRGAYDEAGVVLGFSKL